MIESLSILGIKVNKIISKDILDKIEDFLSSNKQNYLVTLNSEIILKAQKDEEYFHILNNADLTIADGVGLKFAGLATGNNLERITGADLTEKILQIAQDKKIKVAVLNWDKGLSKKEELEKALSQKYPDLKFVVENIERVQDSLESSAERLQRDGIYLQKFEPAILFINLGAPYQEKFIYHNLNKIPSVKLALGVGGSFDFISGKIKRAPLIFQKLGVEWLWRLAMQPKRWKRIYKAVIIFPCKFIKWKFINRFLYRKNVVAFIVNDQSKVLIVNRVGEEDFWGLPQGGIDSGENKDDAILREVKEETNISSVDVLGKFENIYKYRWPKDYMYTGHKGQRQSLYILKFNGENSEIKLSPWELKDWKWVEIDELIKESDEKREEACGIFLEKFRSVKNNKNKNEERI